MQVSGLHLHVDTQGNDAGIHAAHVHQAGPEDHSHDHEAVHDHSAESDVSLLEQLNANWAKLMPLLIICLLATALGVRSISRLGIPSGRPLKTRRRERWRPPLRAPPLSL